MANYKLKLPAGMENAVAGAFQNIQGAVVGAYKRVETRFVEAFLEEVSQDDSCGAADGASASLLFSGEEKSQTKP